MTPIQPEALECALCQRTAPDVHMALIKHTELKDGRVSVYFATDPRCEDRKVCQERAEREVTT